MIIVELLKKRMWRGSTGYGGVVAVRLLIQKVVNFCKLMSRTGVTGHQKHTCSDYRKTGSSHTKGQGKNTGARMPESM